MSQAAFCRQEGIPEWALSNWKRREVSAAEAVSKPKSGKRQYRKRNKNVEFATAGEQTPEMRKQNAHPEFAAFVPLRTATETTAARDIPRDAGRIPVAEICFGEVSVRIWRGADKETVSAVLDSLKEYYTC